MSNSRASSLPKEVTALLVDLWGRVDSNAYQVSRDHLRTLAWQVSLRAREASMLPEELIVGLRESWYDMDSAPGLTERRHNGWVLTEMISLCIEEYFRQANDASNGGGAEHLALSSEDRDREAS